jgi:hypothetical protein
MIRIVVMGLAKKAMWLKLDPSGFIRKAPGAVLPGLGERLRRSVDEYL